MDSGSATSGRLNTKVPDPFPQGADPLADGANPIHRLVDPLCVDTPRDISGAVVQGLAGAGDGEALVVQQPADPQESGDVVSTVEALAAGGALGLQAELGLPVAQHVRFDADQLRCLTDPEEEPVRKIALIGLFRIA